MERRQLPLVLLLVGRGASLKDLWDGGRTTPLRYMKDRYDAAAYRQVWRAGAGGGQGGAGSEVWHSSICLVV